MKEMHSSSAPLDAIHSGHPLDLRSYQYIQGIRNMEMDPPVQTQFLILHQHLLKHANAATFPMLWSMSRSSRAEVG